MGRAETTATMTPTVGTVPQLPTFLKSRNTWGIPCWARPSARTSRPRSEEKPLPMNLSSSRIPMKPLSMKNMASGTEAPQENKANSGKWDLLTPTVWTALLFGLRKTPVLCKPPLTAQSRRKNLRCRQQLPLSDLQIHVRRVYDALYQGIHSGQSG